jgi:hypothetical protein
MHGGGLHADLLASLLEVNFEGRRASSFPSPARASKGVAKWAADRRIAARERTAHRAGESLVVTTNHLLATGAKGPLGGHQWRVEDEPPIREELVRILRLSPCLILRQSTARRLPDHKSIRDEVFLTGNVVQ